MIGPPVGGMMEVGQVGLRGRGWGSNNDPDDDPDGDFDTTLTAMWRERERRQRTVRVVMMFLLLMLLMDDNGGEANNSSRNRNRGGPGGLRKRNKKGSSSTNLNRPLDIEVFRARQLQDQMLRRIVANHHRYKSLIKKNDNVDVENQIIQFCQQQQQQAEQQQQQSQQSQSSSTTSSSSATSTGSKQKRRHDDDHHPPEEEDDRTNKKKKVVFHYPWNSTGFYRGEWVRTSSTSSSSTAAAAAAAAAATETLSTSTSAAVMLDESEENNNSSTSRRRRRSYDTAISLEKDMLNVLAVDHNKETVGVFNLPPGKRILMRDDNNLTTLNWESMTVDSAGRTYRPLPLMNHQQRYNDNRKQQQQQQLVDKTTTRTTTTTTMAGGNSNNNKKTPTVTLAHDSGRAAFQLFSRPIPSMKEMSLVDGFVKLYDSPNPGYSTRKDVLLRVRGVHVNSIGRLSLVSANVDVSRSAFVMEGKPTVLSTSTTSNSTTTTINSSGNNNDNMNEENSNHHNRRRRRLLENLDKIATREVEGEEDDDEVNADNSINDASSSTTRTMNEIRDDTFALFPLSDVIIDEEAPSENKRSRGSSSSFHSPDWREYTEEVNNENNHNHNGGDSEDEVEEEEVAGNGEGPDEAGSSNELIEPLHHAAAASVTRMMIESDSSSTTTHQKTPSSPAGGGSSGKSKSPLPPWSSIVMPYPFTRDDKEENLRRTRTPGARRMPPREQLLEANAADCEFEINMDVQETEWTVGAWRNLLKRRFREVKKLDPSSQHQTIPDPDADKPPASITRPHIRGNHAKANAKALQDQALVVTIIGTIKSSNCNFEAALNATALRTDWEATTAEAINYSFYMMLVCLTQILVLLKQLLHSQSQSTATRVSLICIGWQTIIDALLCLVHIYFSLAMQPLFTAFASVAFFKLLIFCVIEMKYMAMIIQARNSSNGGQNTEVLRRQIAMLHLRFYVALLGNFLLVFYIGKKYRVIYAFALYSFWVPQIIFNIYTEARTPLHKQYIYGMSLSRLVTPLYMFGFNNNFLKEVYPDFTSDAFMCEVLVLWVAVQTAILIAQRKYGARCMIPARFLPPKYDYSRPLPPSMYQNLDSAAAATSSSSSGIENSSSQNKDSSYTEPLVPNSRSEGLSHTTPMSPSRTDRHATAVTTRNRGRGGNRNSAGGMMSRHHHPATEHQAAATMTKEGFVNVDLQEESNHPSPLPAPPQHSLECSICYDSIDTRNRRGYLLAPCDHIFHRDCLMQWMDVKMECPICRLELPAL